MNREILFKGKRLDNGEWVTGRLITDDRDGKEFIVSWIGYHCEEDIDSANRYIECFGFEVDPETVGQYTGLEDKNGVEIYEEDVVKVTYYGEESVHVVKWMGERDYPAFDLEPFLDCDSNGLSYVMCDCECETEVIGNIHDNPELLEVE